MGFLDEIKKLTRPYDDDDDFAEEYEEEYEEAAEEAPARKSVNPFASLGAESAPAAKPAAKREGRVVSIGSAAGAGQMQVVLVKPESFESSAASIADHLLAKRAIVMNLETTPKDVYRRLIDFLSGVAYAQDGKIKKIASNTYIITPYNVNLMGDLIDELETSGLYF